MAGGWITLALLTFLFSLHDNIMADRKLSTTTERFQEDAEIDPITMNPEFTETGQIIRGGDMLYPEDSLPGEERQAVDHPNCRRWKGGEVVYYRNSSMSDSTFDVLQTAMEAWQKLTCVTFRQIFDAGAQIPFVTVKSGNGCYAHVGRVCEYNGFNELSLGEGCDTTIGTPAHEIGHTLGVFHQHVRYDRDEHVRINFQNVIKGQEENFEKKTNEIRNFDVDYDFCSVMHYNGIAFSSNGQPTIEPLDSSNANKMGQRDGLSFADIKLVNRMYDCAANCSKHLSCDAPCFLNKNCTCTCNANTRKSGCTTFTDKLCPIDKPANVKHTTAAPPTATTTWKPTGECDSLVILKGSRKQLWSFKNNFRTQKIKCTIKIQGQERMKVKAKLRSAVFFPGKKPCKTNYFQFNLEGKAEFKGLPKLCGKLPRRKKPIIRVSKGNCLFIHLNLQRNHSKRPLKIWLSSYGII